MSVILDLYRTEFDDLVVKVPYSLNPVLDDIIDAYDEYQFYVFENDGLYLVIPRGFCEREEVMEYATTDRERALDLLCEASYRLNLKAIRK